MVSRKRLLAVLTALSVFVTAVVYSTAGSTFAADENTSFQPSENVMAEVDALLVRARTSGKLALIVMGANWCHDSQGLLAHFNEPEMVAVIDRHYEQLLVDVGMLNKGAEVNRRFGLPVIYGTPTVLVVDPSNERLLNGRDMQQWYNAASIGLADTVAYFMSKTIPSVRYAAVADSMATSDVLKKLLADIDEFEAKQAERIYQGFAIVGPMVAMEKTERPKNFYRLWEQLRVLRYRIPDDLVTLRAMARRRAALGETDIKLDFPQYPALEWEVN